MRSKHLIENGHDVACKKCGVIIHGRGHTISAAIANAYAMLRHHMRKEH